MNPDTPTPASPGAARPGPRFTPPRWLNALMRFMLRTPGLQRLIGRSTALLTFTGRTTGRRYTTPVTYVRRNSTVILTAHPSRRWWRNLADRPEVRLRLGGSEVAGTARVVVGDEAVALLAAYFAALPKTAKASGLRGDNRGKVDRRLVEEKLADTVVVAVDVARQPAAR